MASQLNSPKTDAKAKRKLAHSVEAFHLRRFWPTSSGCEVFLRGRFGLLNTEQGDVLLRFELPRNARMGESDRMRQPWKDVAFLVNLLEQDAGSDLNKALPLRSSIDDPWLWIQWNKGSRIEMERLVRAYLVLTAPNNFSSWFHPHLSIDTAFSDSNGSNVKELLQRMKLQRLLHSAFEAVSSEDVKRIYSLTAYAWKRYHKPLEIRVDEPTSHERLEALLIWRDFLRDKLPPDEIERLLPTR